MNLSFVDGGNNLRKGIVVREMNFFVKESELLRLCVVLGWGNLIEKGRKLC